MKDLWDLIYAGRVPVVLCCIASMGGVVVKLVARPGDELPWIIVSLPVIISTGTMVGVGFLMWFMGKLDDWGLLPHGEDTFY